MAPYHSRFNEGASKQRHCCGCPLLPLNLKPEAAAASGPDIVDEAIELFRPNSLFKSFDIQGSGDKLLVYLTLYINSCLRRILERKAGKEEARSMLFAYAHERFPLPGQAGFALGALLAPPANKEEEDSLRAYLRQCREETGKRLVERIYGSENSPDRLWLGYAHRRFLDRVM